MTAWWQRGWVAVPTEVTVAKKPAGQRARHTKKGTLGGRKHRLGRLGFEKAPHSSGHTAVGSQWSPRGDGRLQEIWESQGRSCGFGAGRVRGPPRDGRWVMLRGPLGPGSPCAHLPLSARNSNMRKGRKGREGRGPECFSPVLAQSPGGSMRRGGERCVKPPQNGDQALRVSAHGSRQPGCGPLLCQMGEGDRGRAPDTLGGPSCAGRDPPAPPNPAPCHPPPNPAPPPASPQHPQAACLQFKHKIHIMHPELRAEPSPSSKQQREDHGHCKKTRMCTFAI